MNKVKEIEIDGTKYVPADQVNSSTPALKVDGLDYVMCRTESAGVFAGYLAKRKGNEAVLKKARRIWYWAGAASLSQLAVDGTSKPSECKFPCEVDEVTLLGVIEIIPMTEKARKSIANVKVWEA